MGPHTGRGEGRPPQQCNEGRLQALPRAPPGSTLLRGGKPLVPQARPELGGRRWCRRAGGAGRRALGELERDRPGDNAVSGPESARLPCQHFADLDPGDALA